LDSVRFEFSKLVSDVCEFSGLHPSEFCELMFVNELGSYEKKGQE
jgi:hypothetical protein